MPYLYKTAIQANKTGVPTMRSMVLEFTEDRTCHYVDKQYMLGDSLLVAPIFNEESLADYYLPAGRWTDFFTGEVKEGGRWIQEKHGYLSVPLLVKENSIVAIGAHDDKPDYDYGEDTELRIYEPAADTTVTETVYGMDGSEEIKISVTTEEGRISVSVDTGKTVSVRLVNRKAKAVENAEMQVTDKDTVLTKIAGKAVVTL